MDDASTGSIAVESSATACTVAQTEVPSGTVTFAVRNTGDEVTEFYLLAADGLEVVAEVENIGPGLTRELVASVQPGTYVAACKPGMVGDGIRTTITVTGSGTTAEPTGRVRHHVA